MSKSKEKIKSLKASKGFLRFLWLLITRAMVFYFLLYFVTCVIVDYDKKIVMALKMRTLNYSMPRSFDYLWTIEEARQDPSDKQLQEYTEFFSKVVDFLPKRFDAYGFLGYCSYHLGDIPQAVWAYQKAIELQPHFFWPYYNLALIYVQHGAYREAITVLNKAVRLNPPDSLAFIRSPQTLYHQAIVKSHRINDTMLEERLTMAYYHSYQLLVLSLKAVGEEEAAAEVMKKVLTLERQLVARMVIQKKVFVRIF